MLQLEVCNCVYVMCGLRYYISPPHSFGEVWNDPIHALFYASGLQRGKERDEPSK